MKNFSVFILILTANQVWSGNYANWQEHTEAFFASQQQQLNNDTEGNSGTVVTVGSDNSCDFRIGATKIQDAIDSSAGEIRIVTATYAENLTIDDISVILVGGYANCTDAANNITDGNLATVDGGFNDSVVKITGDSQTNTVNISNIQFKDGNGGAASGGGIDIRSADLNLNLNNVLLFNNTALINGGGMSVFQGNTNINASDVRIAANFANRGGGIYCIGNDNSIILTGTSGIYQNQATSSDGGGAMLINGCEMTSYVGSLFSVPTIGIGLNLAAEHGGGVALSGGSRLSLIGARICGSVFPFFCVGNNDSPATVSLNVADSDDDSTGNGGGIYAAGSGTVVDAIAVDMNNNSADDGGGIATADGATLHTGFNNSDCWSPGSCNQIRNNKAKRAGGAIYTTGNNTLTEIEVTHIQGNRANIGTAAYVVDNAELTIQASVITGNGNHAVGGFADLNVFRVFGNTNATNTSLKILASTIADNNFQNTVFDNLEGRVSVLSTIIHEPDSGDVYNSTNPELEIFSCVMAHEIISAPAGFNVIEDDPEFLHRTSGDFHLNAMISPAIDFCNINQTNNVLTDIDQQQRGWDDPTVVNFNGPYDIGADESYGGDIIFQDSFDG